MQTLGRTQKQLIFIPRVIRSKVVPRACKIGITLAKLWPLLNCYKIFMKFIFVLVFYSALYYKDFTNWVMYTVFYWLIAVATITFSK